MFMNELRQQFNKEIFLLKLSVTNRCTMACRYCFAVKGEDDMPQDVALASVDFLLRSPGEEKVLMIYGGEPFLCFGLVEKIVLNAIGSAKALNKKLAICIGSNATVIGDEQLEFLRKHDIRLAISIDGRQEFHDQVRLTADGESRYQDVMANAPRILKVLKPENVCVLMGVLPSSTEYIYENLRYLVQLGFSSFNLEPVFTKEYSWHQKDVDQFKTNVARFLEYIEEGIPQRRFVFFNRTNRELNNQIISRLHAKACPFVTNLVVSVAGDMAFSCFLINQKDRDRYVVGNVLSGLKASYDSCVYDSKNPLCRNCLTEYFAQDQQMEAESEEATDKWNEVMRLQDIFAIYFARKIIEKATHDFLYAEYRSEAEKRIFE